MQAMSHAQLHPLLPPLLLLQAAAIQWPEIFKTAAAEAAKPQLVEQMRAVRPVVETGWVLYLVKCCV